ncbi:response regulator [Paludibacter propionicigenes]|uniref:response regulator n=1 Tax=Paludibacter propionicigenes TaxID=185300 RepID=UPI0011D11C0D
MEDILKWMNKQQIRIPFIVMTEYSGISSAVQAMKLGAEDYLPKPGNPDKLYSLLRELFQRKNKPERTIIFRRESKASGTEHSCCKSTGKSTFRSHRLRGYPERIGGFGVLWTH